MGRAHSYSVGKLHSFCWFNALIISEWFVSERDESKSWIEFSASTFLLPRREDLQGQRFFKSFQNNYVLHSKLTELIFLPYFALVRAFVQYFSHYNRSKLLISISVFLDLKKKFVKIEVYRYVVIIMYISIIIITTLYMIYLIMIVGRWFEFFIFFISATALFLFSVLDTGVRSSIGIENAESYNTRIPSAELAPSISIKNSLKTASLQKNLLLL